MPFLEDIDFAGKTSPKEEDLQAMEEELGEEVSGIELYLTPEILEEAAAISNLEQSDLDLVSVHIPHVTPEGDYRHEWTDYLERAAGIANFYDVPLVFHSQFMQLAHKKNTWNGDETLEDLVNDMPSEVLYENNPESSSKAMKDFVEEGIVLDTAHAYCGFGDPYIDRDAYDLMGDVLSDDDIEVGLIHLTDAIGGDQEEGPQDGKNFEEGDIDLDRMLQMIDEYYEGDAVLEVGAPTLEPGKSEQARLYSKATEPVYASATD